MAKSGNQTYRYAAPNPFVTPAIEARIQDLGGFLSFIAAFLPFDIFTHEELLYSGPILENIMFHVSLEYEFRGLGRQTWKAYKSGPDDFDTFVAGGSRNPNSGNRGLLNTKTLRNYPVQWFPLYVKDIQEKIEALVNDGRWPDSLPSLMARIFLNNTTHTGTESWDELTRLPNTITAPAPADDDKNEGEGTEVISVFSRISENWAFPYSESDHVQKVVPRLGIDWRGKAYVQRGPAAIVTSDLPGNSTFTGDAKNQWPRSVIGQRREQEGFRIVEGFVEEFEDEEGNPRGSIDGIDGIHFPGIESDKIDQGRPKHDRRISEENAPLPGAVGKYDPSSGYSFSAHHPHVVHQLRYQPPHVERWDNKTEVKDYVENVFSNLTPNLPWYFSQEVERVHFSDWGGWLIQGRGGLTGPGMSLEAYPDPQHDNLFTQCPFSVFYPPSTANCSCGGANTAYGIWGSATETLIWNQQAIFNFLPNTGGMKFFGPETRLILDASFSLGAGNGPDGGAGWFLGVRTIRISGVNLQPFVAVMGAEVGATDFNIFPAGQGSMNVNLMDAMQFHYPHYEKGGIDALLAIGIFVQTQSGNSGVFDAVDGPTGTNPPSVDLGCAIGTSTATCRKIYLFEPAANGDPLRTPPAFDGEPRTPPPDYNLPIQST